MKTSFYPDFFNPTDSLRHAGRGDLSSSCSSLTIFCETNKTHLLEGSSSFWPGPSSSVTSQSVSRAANAHTIGAGRRQSRDSRPPLGSRTKKSNSSFTAGDLSDHQTRLHTSSSLTAVIYTHTSSRTRPAGQLFPESNVIPVVLLFIYLYTFKTYNFWLSTFLISRESSVIWK